MVKLFRVFNFRRSMPPVKFFNGEFFPNYGTSTILSSVEISTNEIFDFQYTVCMYGYLYISYFEVFIKTSSYCGVR